MRYIERQSTRGHPGREDELSIEARPASAIDGPRLQRLQAPARLPSALSVGFLLLAYVGLEWVSFIHEHKGVPVTPWNPGLGVAFAILVLKGASYGPVLFVGVVTAEIFVLRTELEWPVIVAMAGLVSTSFAMAAALVRRHLHFDVSLTHVRDVLVLLAGGTAAAAVSATLVSVLLLTAGELTTGDLTKSSLPLFVGDVIGISVVTPLVLRLFVNWRNITLRVRSWLLGEVVLHLFVISLTLWMVVGADSPSSYRFLSLLFLPVVVAALRHGIDGSCIVLAATQLGLVALLHQYRYDATAFTEFQVVMLVLTMSGLLVGVVVSERQRSDLAARHAEARLKEMQEEAGRAARMNLVSGMASALAHEINQPITAVRALARSVQQMLRSQAADKERVDTNLSALVAQIDHAGRVVHRMREFLRRRQPHSSTLDIGAVLNEALALARPDASAKKISIELEVGDALPPVFGDRVQLQQVVLNLVHNALDAIVESGRSDGRVRISARRSAHDSALEVSVLDNGGGVSPDLALFEPLSSSKKSGLGLGLSICASIVQSHGGRIWLQSGSAGATEFRFSLPTQGQGAS
jgi:signal transduction histidine kinase